ncbi:MAG: hypothetical protein ACLGGX_00865 [Bdellovibrionia bacterium]
MKMRSNCLKDQGGQALIEYVLMLIISISLLLLLTAQIFTPFKEFLRAYMGTYIQCLLEYGELPALGSEGVGAESECNARFEDFTIGAGRPPKTDGSGGSSASGANNRSDSNRSSSSSSSSSSDGSGRNNSGGGGSSGRTVIVNGSNRRSMGTESTSPDAAKTIEIEVSAPGAGSGRFYSSGGGSDSTSSRTERFITGEVVSDFDQRRLAAQNKQNETAGMVVGENEQARAPKKIAINPPKREVSSLDDEEEEFTIGNFIRILIIAGIIIAIVIFVGGQILQMSKSFSK